MFFYFFSIYLFCLQLEEYKVLAQSLEKRIFNLHKELEKKDDEIARLKKQQAGDTLVPAIGMY